MSKNYVLPPIGNSENPFNSIFNGNGHTISNLVVSTNKKILKDEPAGSDYAFSNSVGMFGMTGEKSDIKNFILTNPIVEVASTKTIDNVAQDTLYSGSDPNAVGLAIGYVGGTASSIGVRGGKIAVREIPENDKYTTFNSILGAIGPNIKTDSVTGGDGASTGGDKGVFYPDEIYNILTDSTNSYHKSTMSNYFTSSKGVVSFSADIWINSSGTNDELGLGGISFTTGKEATELRSQTYNSFIFDGQTINLGEVNSNKEYEQIRNMVVDRNGNQITKLEHDLYYKNSPTLGNTSWTVYNPDGTIRTYKNGNTDTPLSGVALQINSSTIKANVVSNTGKIFVILSASAERNIGVYKAGSANSTYAEPEKYITGTQNGYKEVQVKDNKTASELVSTLTIPNNETNGAYGFLIDLSKEKGYGPGAYVIGSQSNNFNIVYASITGMNDGNADSGEKVEGALSAIDFVYDGVSIDQDSNDDNKVNAGNFIYNNSLYKASQVRITFNIAALTYITYSRTVNGSGENYIVTFTVEYNGTKPTVTGSASNSVTPKNNTDLTDPVN